MPPISDPRILHCDLAGDLYLHMNDVSIINSELISKLMF